MADKRTVWILSIISIFFIILYVVVGMNSNNLNYFLPRRLTRVIAIILVALTISVSTVKFQALTNNRILTPSMLGFDSMYMLTQTTFVFVLGSNSTLVTSPIINFLITLGIMVLFATLLYGVLFNKMGNQLVSMLMIGIILSTLFRSFTSFFQMIIDPNEFSVIQDRSFASFNNMNTNILWIALAISLIIFIIISDEFKKLDVIALGKDHAINLGINYNLHMRKYLVVISFLIATATALVGPIMFLGLLVVNMARAISKTYKHTSLILLSFLLSLVLLVGGQFMLERIFNFALPLSIIINFVGGIYMLNLLKKEMTI